MEFKIGDVLNGRVTKLIKVGAFVDVGEGKTGFVHISEITKKFIKLPSEVLCVNDDVKVKITSIDEDNRIKLSIKQADFDDNCDAKTVDYNEKPEIKVDNFEYMMKKFKTSSEQKLSDLKKHMNGKHNSKQRRR